MFEFANAVNSLGMKVHSLFLKYLDPSETLCPTFPAEIIPLSMHSALFSFGKENREW